MLALSMWRHWISGSSSPIPSMGLAYLPTWMVDFYGFHVGKYIIHGWYRSWFSISWICPLPIRVTIRNIAFLVRDPNLNLSLQLLLGGQIIHWIFKTQSCVEMKWDSHLNHFTVRTPGLQVNPAFCGNHLETQIWPGRITKVSPLVVWNKKSKKGWHGQDFHARVTQCPESFQTIVFWTLRMFVLPLIWYLQELIPCQMSHSAASSLLWHIRKTHPLHISFEVPSNHLHTKD